MANQNKSLWIVLVLVVAGVVILLLSFKPKKYSSNKVVMQEIFSQNPPTDATGASDTARDPVPSPAIVTSPEHGQEAGFAVQVYSFKDEKRADAALANLKSNGYNNAYIEISDLGPKGTYYRVRIGGLQNENQAKDVLEAIRKSFKGGFIVKPK